MACSGDGLTNCPECSCDYSNDCSTCLGEGFVACEGCESCADVHDDPAEAAVGPEPEPEGD